MRTILCVCVYALAVLVLAPVLLVCFVFGLREPVAVIGKAALRLGRLILGLKVDVAGLECLDPKTPCIYMANHLSFLDGPILFAVIPRSVRVLLKKEVFRIPVIGQSMRFIGFVPVDRKGLKAGKRSIDRAVRLMAERGYSFLVFPEGTRSRDGRIRPFKRGGFFLALAGGSPIVPVTIRGSFDLMPRGRFFVKKGTVRVEFHEPVPVAGYRPETMSGLVDRVRDIIRSEGGEDKR
jgi:1-acyl-sn-glycerol-3-phosphate acyltransferase